MRVLEREFGSQTIGLSRRKAASYFWGSSAGGWLPVFIGMVEGIGAFVLVRYIADIRSSCKAFA
jgi:hypothetical protein